MMNRVAWHVVDGGRCCSRAAAGRATRTCATGWRSRARASQRPASTRCRRSSRTSRSRTTPSTCPIRSSRARSSRRRASTSKLAPDLTRRREPLEAYPLESLSMVGTLEKGKARLRARETPEKDIYQVRAGQLHGTELRRRHRHQRHGDQAEGTRAGRRRRLDRAVQHAEPAAGRSEHRSSKK